MITTLVLPHLFHANKKDSHDVSITKTKLLRKNQWNCADIQSLFKEAEAPQSSLSKSSNKTDDSEMEQLKGEHSFQCRGLDCRIELQRCVFPDRHKTRLNCSFFPLYKTRECFSKSEKNLEPVKPNVPLLSSFSEQISVSHIKKAATKTHGRHCPYCLDADESRWEKSSC